MLTTVLINFHLIPVHVTALTSQTKIHAVRVTMVNSNVAQDKKSWSEYTYRKIKQSFTTKTLHKMKLPPSHEHYITYIINSFTLLRAKFSYAHLQISLLRFFSTQF